jgi:hypothetical protein
MKVLLAHETPLSLKLFFGKGASLEAIEAAREAILNG